MVDRWRMLSATSTVAYSCSLHIVHGRNDAVTHFELAVWVRQIS